MCVERFILSLIVYVEDGGLFTCVLVPVEADVSRIQVVFNCLVWVPGIEHVLFYSKHSFFLIFNHFLLYFCF